MHSLPTHPPATAHVVIVACSMVGVTLLAAVGGAWGVLAVLAIATAAAVVDVREHRIPDELVVLASVAVVVTLVFNPASPVDALLGGVLTAGPLLITHLIAPASLGFGDVKLALPLGGALGIVDPVLGLVALCVASAVTAVVGLSRSRAALPFAPGLVTGVAAAMAMSYLTDWFPS